MYILISKVTLDLYNSQEKFGGFLHAALDVLSQLLELATLHDIGKVNTVTAATHFHFNSCVTTCESSCHASFNYSWQVVGSFFYLQKIYVSVLQCVEEILGYLKSCFSREPTMATVCVQQVCKLSLD